MDSPESSAVFFGGTELRLNRLWDKGRSQSVTKVTWGRRSGLSQTFAGDRVLVPLGTSGTEESARDVLVQSHVCGLSECFPGLLHTAGPLQAGGRTQSDRGLCP